MGFLAIRKLHYVGEHFELLIDKIENGLNIIEGPNGTGKTTLAELIYFALGGSAAIFNRSSLSRHAEITADINNQVILEIEIDSIKYEIVRKIYDNDITISSGADLIILPVNRSKNEKFIFSDWLLDKLGIPRLEIFLGSAEFVLNFRDIARLIYHDQKLERLNNIYKGPDHQNIYTDSEMVRKIIFEVLIGHKSSEYYSNISELKSAELEKRTAKQVLSEFKEVSATINEEDLNSNLSHLDKVKRDFEEQLGKIHASREALSKTAPNNADALDRIERFKEELIQIQHNNYDLKEKYSNTLDELLKLNSLFDESMLEVTQIKKIIATHQSLNLFSPDTCPYCLRVVEREEGHCVCGQQIDEAQYEKFFYDASEYNDILKRKQRSILTIEEAISLNKKELKSFEKKLEDEKERENKLKLVIRNEAEMLHSSVDLNQLSILDKKHLEISEELLKLEQKIKIMQRLDKMQSDLDSSDSKYQSIYAKNKVLEGSAKSDMHERVVSFNKIYNEVMKNSLAECHSAKIDFENYMPIINNGEYREASSTVTIRLLYYITLLKLALDDLSVKFPRLLVLDTPETAGIDAENLIRAVEQIKILDKSSMDYQIILTTGENKYPKEFEDRIIRKLTKESKLLTRKT
ncbi:hypothetical protein CH370_09570 [Leptospira kmetyi]|uniref:AAA family ATPase n=1 Tax=Leptospira kmetyi TaxID=408139 RepID=UPI000C2AE62F|nr:AAA family ATPase [Leptospira kmetyi]PJZ41681.1 hypothetical protein CH370_09570 [Leptospira kmetyi]